MVEVSAQLSHLSREKHKIMKKCPQEKLLSNAKRGISPRDTEKNLARISPFSDLCQILFEMVLTYFLSQIIFLKALSA